MRVRTSFAQRLPSAVGVRIVMVGNLPLISRGDPFLGARGCIDQREFGREVRCSFLKILDYLGGNVQK